MQTEEKFFLSLEKAKHELQTADHLAYITFPIVKENKLLLKVLEDISQAILDTINAILQYEYTYKRIQIYSTARDNFETFKRISPRYNLSPEQLRKLLEILSLAEKHKKSPFEFTKHDKIIIMSDNMGLATINLEIIKTYIMETKDFLRKVGNIIKKT